MAQITVPQVIAAIMLEWGVENPDASSPAMRARAMSDLNRAVELIWANAERLDYFNQTTINLTVPANTGTVALPAGIQDVIGPVRRQADLVPLNPIKERFEYENYSRVYCGQDSLAAGPLIAYYLLRQFQSAPDAINMSLCPVPQAAAETVVLIDIVSDAPSYSYASDYCSNTVIPIPHAYGAAILIPIARHNAMSSYFFIKPERAPMLEAEYQSAMRELGIVVPDIKENDPPVAAEAPLQPQRGSR